MTWFLTVHMEDAYQRKTTKRYQIVAATHVAAEVVRDAFLPDIANVTECDVVSSTLSENIAYADSVTAGANVDAGAIYRYSNSGGVKSPDRVPSPEAATILSNGSIDTTEVNVIAFVANFTGGDVLLSDGEVMVASHGGYLER